MNKCQATTGVLFYCRYSAGFSLTASIKLSCNLIPHLRDFETGNKNIPPIRKSPKKFIL